jgi:tetratricopeptide (TPR) repeat protein
VTGYSTRDLAAILGVSPAAVRTLAKTADVCAERSESGELRFGFADLLLLKTAAELRAAHVPARKIRTALGELSRKLPSGTALSSVRIAASGDGIVVRDGREAWEPLSGQLLFEFAAGDLVGRRPGRLRAGESLDADAWFDRATRLEEEHAPEDAIAAYRRAIALDPRHADAHVNLGRLLHETGSLRLAERHYRAALQADPRHATAAFNRGVVLEELGQSAGALAAYRESVAIDPAAADAHYNLAVLCRRLGLQRDALRHLKRYRELARTDE